MGTQTDRTYASMLRRKRTRNVKSLPVIAAKEICGVCQNRKRFAAIYMVLDLCTSFLQIAGKDRNNAEMRVGMYLCKPCAKRIVNRIEATIDEGWH